MSEAAYIIKDGVRTVGDSQRYGWENAALLDQTAVQNIWYTVISQTGNVKLNILCFSMETANETVEVELTLSGHTETYLQSAIAGTVYKLIALNTSTDTVDTYIETSSSYSACTMLEGYDLVVRARKTTAAGANKLRVKVAYQIKGV